jgi:hypothetical protein
MSALDINDAQRTIVKYKKSKSARGAQNSAVNKRGTSINIFVTMKNAVFSDVTPCGFCKMRRFGGT